MHSFLSRMAVLTALVLTTASGPVGHAATSEVSSSWIEVRGRVRCLEGDSTPADPALDPCNEPGARFTIELEDAGTLSLLPEDPMAEMFIDPRMRSRNLALRGWTRPGSSFEILSVFSVVDGELHHVHYRCDVCDITATAPGPCWCCGANFELREVPVRSVEN